MAEVYLAVVEDRIDSGALRVVKILPKSFAADPSLVDMFLDEARLAMRLGHPHIVQTMEAGRTADDSLFMAMEWLEGASVFRLAQRARELAEELPPSAVVAILLQVLDGLAYLHDLKDLDGAPLHVIHRDVTPSNIFVASTGHVKLLDFGIAKTSIQHAVTQVGVRKGKLAYLAPEMLTGGSFDRRADVYGCGVVLWELLAGRRLWRGAAALEKKSVPPRLEELGVPTPLADVCAKALARDPADRYASALAMSEELERAAILVGGAMRGPELARLVEQLLGEDISNVRRLAANAIRTGREDSAGERMTMAPEGTSVTVRPAPSRPSRSRLVVGVAMACAASAALTVGAYRGLAPPEVARPTLALRPIVVPVEHAVGDPPAPPATARITIQPRPDAAVVTVDGRALDGPPYTIVVPADHRPMAFRVTSPGHVARDLVIPATGDAVIEAVLNPIPVAPPPRRAARAAPSTPSVSASGRAPGEASARLGPRPPVRALDVSDPW